jgi:hypothetical protein
MTIVTPDKVQFGDLVSVNGEQMIVMDIEGPDHTGTYDFYLAAGEKVVHQVVNDTVALVR